VGVNGGLLSQEVRELATRALSGPALNRTIGAPARSTACGRTRPPWRWTSFRLSIAS